MDIDSVVSILIPATFVVMLVIERLFPARALPKIPGWLLKGVVFFVLSGTISALVPAIMANAMGARAPFHLDRIGTAAGAIVGFLCGDQGESRWVSLFPVT
jgi:hypothetical protein